MKSAWIDYYGNVRNTYGNAGDGEIIEVDKERSLPVMVSCCTL